MSLIKFYAVFTITMSMMTYGCEQEELKPNVCLDCEFECLLDSVPWDAQVTSCYLHENFFDSGDTTFSIIIKENNPLDAEPDHLSFSEIPASPGHYIVTWNTGFPESEPSASLANLRKGYKIENYVPDDTLESFINVEAIDLKTREWRVNFTLFLRFNKPDYFPQDDPKYARSFTITQGFARGKFPE